MFQSSAGFDPGRYKRDGDSSSLSRQFQSSAGFDPGRYGEGIEYYWAEIQFQSSAGFDPGRYCCHLRAASLIS